tara:strand:+ start:1963 stop:4308 length:2346 start_codon:yes stop_codon:yes gene_type:complete
MRTKLRVLTVVLLITLSVYAGIVFSEHSRNADKVYDDFYDETNFSDLIITTYEIDTRDNLSAICESFENEACETSLVLSGQANRLVDSANPEWLISTFYGLENGSVNSIWAIEGSIEPGAGEIVIDAHFAQDKDIEMKIGDSIEIIVGESGSQTLEVVGFANSPLELFYAEPGSILPQTSTFVVGYLDAEYLANISGNTLDARNTLGIDLEGTPQFDLSDTDENEGEELQVLKDEISSFMTEAETNGTVADRGELSAELLRLDKEGIENSTPFILGVLLFISGLVIAVSLDRLIRTQAREIAVLRTIGASTKDIMFGYLLIPLVLGIPGVLAGVLLGISSIGSEAFTAFYFSFLGIPVVETHHYSDIILTISFSALGIIFLFGIRPAWKAAKLQPLEILGQGTQRTPNKIISSLTSKLPPGIGLGLRSTFRKPARLVVTLLALSLAMVILGGTMMFISGFSGAFNEAVDEQENWEYQIAAYPSNIDNITQWAQNDTLTFELTLTNQATLFDSNKDLTLKGYDVLSENDDAMHRFNLLDGTIPEQGKIVPEVILDEGSAELESYSIGDTLTIDFEGKEHDLKVVGIARELTRSIHFHRADLSQIVDAEANGALVVLSDEGNIEDVRFSTISIVEKEAMVEGFNELIEQQKNAMQAVYVLGGIMAIAILFNTLLINLSERDSELATLRVLGASRTRLAVILTVEHTFIGLVGGIAGALASIAYYAGMSNAFSTWAFHIPVIINTAVFLQIIGFVLVAALLTTPVGILRIGRMNLLEVVARHER